MLSLSKNRSVHPLVSMSSTLGQETSQAIMDAQALAVILLVAKAPGWPVYGDRLLLVSCATNSMAFFCSDIISRRKSMQKGMSSRPLPGTRGQGLLHVRSRRWTWGSEASVRSEVCGW